MGGVAVLNPQDVLNFNRMPLISPPSTNDSKLRGRNPNSNRRKRSPQKKNNDFSSSSRSPPPKSSDLARSTPKGSLVMGKVKILKRGEALTKDEKDGKKNENHDSIEMVLSRLGPEPEMVPKQIRLAADFYAGSAFDASPPPSSLPVPEFFIKKRAPEVDLPKKIDLVKKNDDSSSDLCRLLKLAGIEITP